MLRNGIGLPGSPVDPRISLAADALNPERSMAVLLGEALAVLVGLLGGREPALTDAYRPRRAHPPQRLAALEGYAIRERLMLNQARDFGRGFIPALHVIQISNLLLDEVELLVKGSPLTFDVAHFFLSG